MVWNQANVLMWSPTAAGAAGGEEDGSTPPETKDTKAAKTQQSQARRAQVRSAQIRHRQRKANYQKQLELDISEYRELLSRVDAETAALRSQNATIIAKLREAGAGDQDLLLVLPSPHNQHDTVTPPPPPADGGKSQSLSPGWTDDSSRSPPGQQHHQATTPELFGGIDVNSLTVTLGMDEAMGTPTLHISPTASSAGESFGGTATSSLYSPSSCALEPTEPAQLTPLQEQTVINFILSFVPYFHPLLSPPVLYRTVLTTTAAQPRARLLEPFPARRLLPPLLLPRADLPRPRRRRARPRPHGLDFLHVPRPRHRLRLLP